MTNNIILELTLDELKLIDKYVELNDETESVFDKIKDAYPKPKTMTELSLKWKQIFDEISTADDHITGKINYYNLASILEDLYVENAELKARVEALEKDNELLKSYAWEQ